MKELVQLTTVFSRSFSMPCASFSCAFIEKYCVFKVNVVDRPITQQGLSGLRPGTRGPQMRQVQDKRYFEGLLQMKIRELSQEIECLSKDIEKQSREQATFLVYDKRVKEMAAELTGE